MRRRKKKQKSKLHMPWRENLECLAAAIVMALVLKYFVVEAYKIPTGSMQPTLMGDDGSKIYDRILVDKVSYRFRDPRRWEVVVFKYPLDLSKNYVKRLVGLPGERLAVADGNLWVTTRKDAPTRYSPEYWTILRKPVSVQRDLWKSVFEWDDPKRSPEKQFGQHAEVTSGAWQMTGDGMRTKAGESFKLVYPDKGSVMDVYQHGYSSEVEKMLQPPASLGLGKNRVGDLRLEVELVPDANVREVELVIHSYRRIHRFTLAGPAGNGKSSILWNGALESRDPGDNPSGECDFALEAGEGYDISVEACDQRLRLVVDGQEKLAVLYDGGWNSTDPRKLEISGSNGDGDGLDVCRVELGLDAGSALFERLGVYRDIHYLPRYGSRLLPQITYDTDWANPFRPILDELAPEDCYFMMGDNTQNSLDSRGWTEVTMRSEETGRMISGNENPQGPDRNPRPSRAHPDFQVLRTKYGFEHLAGGPASQELAPYVKREYIIGKALLVFWPLPPFAVESRWKFIL